MKKIAMIFSRNFLFRENGPLRAHWVISDNSGSTVIIVLQLCTMKGAKRDMEIILTFFSEKRSH